MEKTAYLCLLGYNLQSMQKLLFAWYNVHIRIKVNWQNLTDYKLSFAAQVEPVKFGEISCHFGQIIVFFCHWTLGPHFDKNCKVENNKSCSKLFFPQKLKRCYELQ